jgi:hypothetical protein
MVAAIPRSPPPFSFHFIGYSLVDAGDELGLVVPIEAITDEIGLLTLLEDVGDERLVVPHAVLASQLGLAVLLEDVGDELGLVIPLTALAVSIGCCDIGQGLGSKDDVNGTDPPQPRVQ